MTRERKRERKKKRAGKKERKTYQLIESSTYTPLIHPIYFSYEIDGLLAIIEDWISCTRWLWKKSDFVIDNNKLVVEGEEEEGEGLGWGSQSWFISGWGLGWGSWLEIGWSFWNKIEAIHCLIVDSIKGSALHESIDLASMVMHWRWVNQWAWSMDSNSIFFSELGAVFGWCMHLKWREGKKCMNGTSHAKMHELHEWNESCMIHAFTYSHFLTFSCLLESLTRHPN